MKIRSFFTLTLIIFILFASVSCNKEEEIDSTTNSETLYKSIAVENTTDEKLYEELKPYLAEALISFNLSVSEFYNEGMEFNEFIDALDVNTEKSDSVGLDLLNAAFYCLENQIDDEMITNEYNGKEMYFVLVWSMNNPDSDGAELFGTTSMKTNTPCAKWWYVGCHLKNAWNWIINEDHRDDIKEVIDWAITLKNIRNLF